MIGTERSYYGHSALGFAGSSNHKENVVFYLLKDHASTADLRSALSTSLGSTNLILDSSGNLTSEMRYKAWGETRYTSGASPTTFGYTGQRQEFGLIISPQTRRNAICYEDPCDALDLSSTALIASWKGLSR